MPYYVYVPNNESGQAGTIVGAFDDPEEAACEQALHGMRATVIEAPKPTFGHLRAYVAKGWRKCEACGGITPPWRSQNKTEEVKG